MSWTIGPVPLLVGLAGGYQLVRLMISKTKEPGKPLERSTREWIAANGTASFAAALLLYPIGGIQDARVGGMSLLHSILFVSTAYIFLAAGLEWCLALRGQTPSMWTGVGSKVRTRKTVANVAFGLILGFALLGVVLGLFWLLSFVERDSERSFTVPGATAELLLGNLDSNFALAYSIGLIVGMFALGGIYTFAHEFVRWREQVGDDAGQR